MAENTVLFTFEADTGRARWFADGSAREGTLSELAASDAGTPVWLFDSRQVQLAEVELPAAGRREQAQALPFALEEQLLSPLEELAFAAHALSPTRQACAVVERKLLEAGLAACEQAGLQVARCVPDVLCAPWRPDTWTLLFADDSAWLRSGPYQGQRFTATQWRPFLEQSLSSREGEQRLRVFGADAALCAEIASVSPALLVETVADPGGALARFAAVYEEAAGIDLLSALPRRRGTGEATATRAWWWACAATVLLVAVAHAGFLAWHSGHLATRLAQEQARTLETFRELFPGITRVEDVRAQATQALAELAARGPAQAPFLDLLATAGAGITQGAADGLILESLSYGNGALELRVRALDMGALERYQQTLAAARLPVQLLSVESRDNRAVGLLRVGAQ
jgi:general secretion pathway protein L